MAELKTLIPQKDVKLEVLDDTSELVIVILVSCLGHILLNAFIKNVCD